MQNWRDLVTSFPDQPEAKDYGKALRTAEILISEDLAPFEIEWLAQTLLFKPVHLFETISWKRKSEDWFKNVSDSFKILSKLVDKYWDVVETYYTNVIELCMLPFDVQTRKEAILCLLSVVKHTDVEVSEEVVSRHVAELEQAKTCKAPLAYLVGTICRYHPEMVQDKFERIWRIYLSMLQPNNKTDTLVNSVLQGVNGLFEYFGNDLQIEQLNRFYDQISRECIKISKCLDVLLSIFKHHAALFKERLAQDEVLRLYLWQIETKNAMEALSNIYKIILPEVTNKEEIIKREVLPHAHSPSAVIKHSAIRIIVHAQCVREQLPSLCGIDLEYLLRIKKLSYEEANTVSWVIEGGIDSSETMLLTAIMFYDNLPSNKKRDVVVNGILNATDETRKSALILLLKLSLQDNLDKYVDIWRVLLDNTSGPDLAKSVVIFEEVMGHMLEVLSSLGDTEKLYEETRPIFTLTSVLLSLQKQEYHTADWCTTFRPSLVHLAKGSHAAVEAISGIDDATVIYAERFQEDTVLNKLVSTLYVQDTPRDDTLSALQVIFSREKTDLKVLSIALTKLDDLIRKGNSNLDKRQLSMMINQILKLKSNNALDIKDARIFHKDVALFLGKYGDMVQNENFSEDIYVMKIRNKVTLNIPNIVEATVYKIDLQRILQLCLLWEEREALYSLLVILTANLCDRSDPCIQEATIRVIHSLFKTKRGESETDIAVYPALIMCNTVACVQTLMKIMTQEQCPNMRRKLSDCLEVLLTHDPGSELTSQLVDTVAEQVAFLLSTDDPFTMEISLDITKAFLAAFKDNNSLAIDHLPNILISTSNTKEQSGTFDLASKLYIEKIDLLTHQVKDTILKIIERFTTDGDNNNIENILVFIKRVIDIKNYDPVFLVEGIFDLSKNLNYISPQFLNIVSLLANFDVAFELNSEVKRSIVGYNNGLFLGELIKLKCVNEDYCKMAAVLAFLKQYQVELYEFDTEKISQCIFNIVEHMDPRTIMSLKNNFAECLNVYKTKLNQSQLQESFEKWTKKLDLNDITDIIKDKTLFRDFSDDISNKIQSLKIMSDLLEFPTEKARSWTVLLLQNLSENEFKWGRLFLSDLLYVSEKSLLASDFEEILDKYKDFVGRYINVYFRRLVEKPFLLKEDNCFLLTEVMEYYSKVYKDEYFDNILELVENLWPSFETSSSIDQKQSILINLLRLPKSVGTECLPIKWAITLLTTEGTSLEDKTKIIGTLPAGNEYSILYRAFASCLPVRLSEMQGQYIPPLRALLDTLGSNGDTTLLDIVITLAGGDDSKGWWDYAIDACMLSLASKQDKGILSMAYKRSRVGNTLGVCNRVFLPLLRHSSRKFCEEYIASIVPDLFNTRIAFKQPANNEGYRKQVASYAVTFSILKIAFDKIPPENLECGILNQSSGSSKPWHFMEQTCKYCVTVSANTKCPDGASADLKETCLWLQSSAYNCLTAAICRRKPNKKLYTRIFNAHAWENIVDKDAVYQFELQAYSTYRGSRPTKRPVDAMSSSSFTGTVRSKLFLTTLSENPLQYDMIPEDEEEDYEDEECPEFEDSVLNAHGCLSTLASLLEHASTLEHTEWRSILITALTTESVLNVKWLLSQAICNAAESLKLHAVDLTPALLHLIADTPQACNNKFVLNNLHLDILTTIINWNIPDLTKNEHLDQTIEYLISTSMEYKYRKNLQKRLLDILNNILRIYGHIVDIKWNIFKDYCRDLPKDLISLLPTFEKILKNKVALPDLLPTVFSITDAKIWSGTSKLSEVCGLALSLADSGTRREYLLKFWTILSSARSSNASGYIKILYYAQKHSQECCDFQQFKNITDLSTKIEKSKCLNIISNYLESASDFNSYYNDMFEIISLCELLESELKVEALKIAGNGLKYMSEDLKAEVLGIVAQNCKNSSVGIRKEAYSVILKAFQAKFKRPSHFSSKRRALDTTPILDAVDSPQHDQLVLVVAGGIYDGDEIAAMVMDGLEECLSEDLTLRFAELFYLLVYQSFYTKIDNLDLRNCGYKLLSALFKDLRNNDAFNSTKVREEGLPQSILKVYEALTTRSKPKTVLRSSVTFRQTVKKATERREIDVQIRVAELLDTFLQLAKVNSEACLELCAQVMKCLQGAGRRFDLNSVICKQLYGIMKRDPNCLTPLVLEACRIFVNGVSRMPGFKEAIDVLNRGVRNSEGYIYTNILYEDLAIRSGDINQFVCRMMQEDSDVKMNDEEFSLQGLIEVFGSLSNWDSLRSQERQRIENSLPPLWSKEDEFKFKLRQYFEAGGKELDYSLWFNKMVASYYPDDVIQDRISWLKQTEEWPKREFVTSAIIEAIQWHQSDVTRFPIHLSKSHCLAEWTARLMIRSSFHHLNTYSDDHETVNRVTLSDELAWCREANDRKLPYLALQCVERNKELLLDVDILPWITEKVSAYRTIGLKDNNIDSLRKALGAAERQAARYAAQSPLETNVAIQKLILQLNHDLNSLSTSKLDDIIQNVNIHLIRQKGGTVSCKNKQALKTFYQEALVFYDEQWNDDDKEIQNTILLRMTEIIAQILDHNLSRQYDLLVSVLLNRIAYSGVAINDGTAEKILDQINRVFNSLDFFSIAILKKIIPMLPTLKDNYLDKFKDDSVDTCKMYFQLICDSNYSLLQYCDNLRRNLLDETKWNKTFGTMKRMLLETPYGGTDYQSLVTIKNKLYALGNMDDIDTKNNHLKSIIEELRPKTLRSTLRLSQLCPKLCDNNTLEHSRRELQRLLRLPPNVYIIKFCEKISVFTDSIRRPCVITALLSNGSTRRYITKCGESLYRDASIQRVASILPDIAPSSNIISYHVTPLGDESAIIEYLEDHVRLRDLMEKEFDIDSIGVSREANDRLILAPSLALEQYHAMCDKVPPHILRSAIEHDSSCLKEFIVKKQTFGDTLATMTILNWLFDIGDRHLQNILYDCRGGALRGVDLAAATAAPPARLTRCLLAVPGGQALESRLQNMLSSLRDCCKILEAFIKTSFYWMEPNLEELKHVLSILNGTSISYDISKELIEKSDKKYKQKHLELLDEVFKDFTPKTHYSVEEQFCGTNSTSGIKRICCLEEEIQGTSEILKILRTHDECLSLQTINRKPKEPLTQGEKAWKMCLKYQNEAVFPCGIRRSDITRLDFCSYNHGNEDRTTSGGGVDAKSNEFPHMALLGYGKYFSEAEFNCGGSLISERFVLTAGHCTVSVGVGKVSFAVFGTLYRKRKPLQKYIYEVKTIIKHPMYKPPIKYNDIALLEMDRQVKFDAFVIPACLHVGDQVDDSRAYGTGWGIYDRSKTIATKLQNVPLWKIADEACRLKFSSYTRLIPNGIDNATQMCYGDDGTPRDTCAGDSGGPLQIKSKDIYCMYLILGVTSFGYTTCAEVGYPGVYTRVSHYVPWIESVVWP